MVQRVYRVRYVMAALFAASARPAHSSRVQVRYLSLRRHTRHTCAMFATLWRPVVSAAMAHNAVVRGTSTVKPPQMEDNQCVITESTARHNDMVCGE